MRSNPGYLLKYSLLYYAKSLERSPAVGDFYGTRIEIWARFGLVPATFEAGFLMFSWAKKVF